MTQYNKKYRTQSTRLQHWDYGNNAAYFITICCKSRVCYFGDVEENQCYLSAIGNIAETFWQEIPAHFSFVQLGCFVVMPNHVHGIIIIDKPLDHHLETRQCLVSTTRPIGSQRFQNQGKNTLSSIVGSYKSVVTKHARKLNANFAWQSRFYDHIIRNEQSFQTISDYILNNPTNWARDDLFEAHK